MPTWPPSTQPARVIDADVVSIDSGGLGNRCRRCLSIDCDGQVIDADVVSIDSDGTGNRCRRRLHRVRPSPSSISTSAGLRSTVTRWFPPSTTFRSDVALNDPSAGGIESRRDSHSIQRRRYSWPGPALFRPTGRSNRPAWHRLTSGALAFTWPITGNRPSARGDSLRRATKSFWCRALVRSSEC